MSLTINTKVYSADAFASDNVGYIGTLKTLTVKDDVNLRRSSPKPSATYSGNGKTFAKMTRTLTLTGALTPTGDAILEIAVQVPVGFSAADVDTLLNDMGSFLSSASFKTHVKSQQISF